MSYIWVFGVSQEGKKTLAGPFTDEYEATNAQDDLVDSKRFNLKYGDRARATRIIKQKLREGGASTDEALERVYRPQEEDSFVDNLKERVGQLTGRNKSPEADIFDGDPFKD